jgi:hypothetical protein
VLVLVVALSGCAGDDGPELPKYCKTYPGGPGRWERIDTRALDMLPAATDGTPVWNGRDWFVFGGMDRYNCSLCGAGFRYRPETRELFAMSSGGAPGVRLYGSVWLETQMLVWGGEGRASRDDGWLYDPETDSWSRLEQSDPHPAARDGHVLVNTGSEVLLWGGIGWYGSDGVEAFRDGWKLRVDEELGEGTWEPISLDGASDADSSIFTVWTGSELLLWSGVHQDPVREPDGTTNWDNGRFVTGGAAYDPTSDTWRPMNPTGGPVDSGFYTPGIWTGTEMIAIGYEHSGAYDPVLDRWRSIHFPLRTPFEGTAAWTGSEVIVVTGGECPAATAYDPALDSWRWLSMEGGPAAFRSQSVWTGNELLLWGGLLEVHYSTPAPYLYTFTP